MIEHLTDDDRAAVTEIAATDDDRERLRLVMAYWHDLDRAERTPRSIMYLHLGLLSGMCERFLDRATQRRTLDVGDRCPLCLAIGAQLQKLIDRTAALYLPAHTSPEDLHAHVLAAICSWWIAESFLVLDVGPEAIVRCVANCLAHDHGVQGADRLLTVRLSKTT